MKLLTVSIFLSAGLMTVVANAGNSPAKSSHDWTGLYAGVHAGFGESSMNGMYDRDDEGYDPGDIFVDEGEGTFELNPKDYIGGIQIGYNHQLDNIVFGIEADVSGASWKESLKYGRDNDELSTSMSYLATARLRIGLANGNLLVYATGGAAMSDTSFTGNDDYLDTDPDEIGTVDFEKVGLAYGAGLEYALNSNVSIKADALLINFDDEIDTEFLQSGDSKLGDFVKFEDAFVTRFGINYHF